MQLRDGPLFWQELSKRRSPKQHDHLGVNELDLAEEPMLFADLQLLYMRETVIQRSAFHAIGDKDVLAAEAVLLEQPNEEPTRRSHEGLALSIFRLTGSLAH